MATPMSFKLAPNVHLRSTASGLRSGAGSSTPLAKTTAGARRAPTLADLERQDRATKRARQREQVAQLERRLTTLHLESFPLAQPPTYPAQDAGQRRTMLLRGRATSEPSVGDIVRAQHAYEQALLDWRALLAHDSAHVIAAVDAAFADNASSSTCIDAGLDPATRQHYQSCVVLFGSPNMVPEFTADVSIGGKPVLRQRSRRDRNDVYLTALASTILATAHESLATSPTTDRVDVLVLRATQPGLLEAVSTARLERRIMRSFDYDASSPVLLLASTQEWTYLTHGSAHEAAALPITDLATIHVIQQFTEIASVR